MCNRTDPVLEFLESVRGATIDLNRCALKIEELDTQCRSITAKMSDAPGGGSGDKHKDALWAALADQRSMYWERYKTAEQKKIEVESFISLLDDPIHRAVLSLHYVDMLTWPRVEEALQKLGVYYSDRHIFRYRDAALQAARKLWYSTNRGKELGDENRNSEA